MSHQCPGPQCPTMDVDDAMLACSRHWYQVPRAVRSAVWRAWRNGAGAGTSAHAAAMSAAVAHMHPLPPAGDAR